MTYGAIYYTDNLLEISFPNISKICRDNLTKVYDGELICCSLKPTNFGTKNIVLENRVRSYPTMTKQILMALEASTTDFVYFLEHDVLYSPTHFKAKPSRNDVYCYNVNNWRWQWPTPTAISYDGLNSLSGLCCNREQAIKHYEYRLQVIAEQGLDDGRGREPRWARRFGYEPGTKPIRRGGLTNEEFERWRSEIPNIDIRHRGTFTRSKITLEEFTHAPTNWIEIPIEHIPGWDLKGIFGL